jgi:hypothetical protein
MHLTPEINFTKYVKNLSINPRSNCPKRSFCQKLDKWGVNMLYYRMGKDSDVAKALQEVDEAAKISALKESVGAKGKFQMKELKEWHKRAIEAIVFDAKSVVEVADKFDTNAGYLSKVYRSDAGLAHVNKLLNRFDLRVIRAKVKFLSEKALRVLQEILDSDDPDDKQLKVKVAIDILNRAGLAEPKEHKIVFEHIYKGIAKVVEDNAKVFEAEIIEEEVDAETEES